MTASPSTIAAEKYVSLVTFRKNGDAVASPVWITSLPDGSAGFSNIRRACLCEQVPNVVGILRSAPIVAREQLGRDEVSDRSDGYRQVWQHRDARRVADDLGLHARTRKEKIEDHPRRPAS